MRNALNELYGKERQGIYMARYFVDAKSDKIIREDLYLVRLEKADGESVSALEPKRLFPYTRPDEYVTLIDENMREVAVIRSMSELSEDSRRALDECMAEIYMIPKISRVVECVAKFGTLRFDVVTERGPIRFRIRNPHSDIKLLGKNRLMFRDSDDNRYEIPDVEKLDKHSRRKLFPYL